MLEPTYCVRRLTRAGGSYLIARNLQTLAEAAEVALRLTILQRHELGGDDDFCVEPD